MIMAMLLISLVMGLPPRTRDDDDGGSYRLELLYRDGHSDYTDGLAEDACARLGDRKMREDSNVVHFQCD